MASIDNSSSSSTAFSDSSDLESGPLHVERITLRVNGLKSGCCGTSITRAVNHIHSVKKHHLNLVTARLYLDLDISRLSVTDIIKQLNNKTGFTFEPHIASTGQTLDLVTSDVRRIQQYSQPCGVSRLETSEECLLLSSQSLSGCNSSVTREAPPSRARTTSMGTDSTVADFVNE
ncbi:hypothetical protein J1614_010011 [Plenodomus biglobosus]|nr:hypothetical protein J1614_010011 [Plenodomus biglobosus]